ncbi:hypothetical protein AB6C58_05105 [Vibrio splendidus]
MLDNLSIAWGRYTHIFIECLATFTAMLNAKFLFFAIVAVGIGTMGIWVPVAFDLDLNESVHLVESSTQLRGAEVKQVDFLLEDKSIIQVFVKYVGQVKNVTFENFSVFMYVISILGVIAAENFIKGEQPGSKNEEALHSFSLFIWSIAFVLSFWALKEPKELTWQLIVSFWLSVSLWLSISVKSDHFLDIKDTAKKLNGTRVSEKNNDESNFNGGGVSD